MQIFTSTAALVAYCAELHARGDSIGFVPTMGALHEGHLSLVKSARLKSKRVIASIFVNPSQFNDPSDLKKYPRTLEKDIEMLASVGTTALFAPESSEEIYGKNFQTWVNNEKLSALLEGASRPGHFRGVTSVVSILFNLVRPTLAVFGEKDFQQLRIIEDMVRDLKLQIEIVRGPIIREEGGLAMSSRNARLSPKGRESALAINRGIRIAREAFQGGERSARTLRTLALDVYATDPLLQPDYVTVVREDSLEEVSTIEGVCRMLVAVNIEGIRLIDNCSLAA